jgi:integrase
MGPYIRNSDRQVFIKYLNPDRTHNSNAPKYKTEYFGKESAESLTRAAMRHAEVQTELKTSAGILPQFTEVANGYMTARKIIANPVNFENQRIRFNAFIIPFFGSIRVDRITHDTFDQYVKHRKNTGVKNSTFNRELTDVKAALNWGVKRGYIFSSPMVGYKFPPDDDAKIHPVTNKEVQLIIKHSAEHLKRAILLGYFCGMRPGSVELLSIRYSQVDWERNELTVYGAKKGGYKYRTVPIHPDLPLLSWFKQDGEPKNGYIITWAGKPVKSVQIAFNNAKKRAGIPSFKKLPMYALRHAFVTNLLHLGADIHTISELSGHSPKTILKHYAHATDSVKRNAVNLLSNPIKDDEE